MNIQKLMTINVLVTSMVFLTSCGGGESDKGNPDSGGSPSNPSTNPTTNPTTNPNTPVNPGTPQARQGKLIRSNETKLTTYFQSVIKQSNTVKNVNESFQGPVATPVLASADGSFSAEATFSSAPTASTTSNASGATGATGGILSSTNIQERGVDEADLLKTDASGRYLFSIKKRL